MDWITLWAWWPMTCMALGVLVGWGGAAWWYGATRRELERQRDFWRIEYHRAMKPRRESWRPVAAA